MNYRPCLYCQQQLEDNPVYMVSQGKFKKGNRYYERKTFYCRVCKTTETSTTGVGKAQKGVLKNGD